MYVTRERGGRGELLVFDHRDHPDALTQVPGGGVDEGEEFAAAVLRELEEEAGLRDVEIVRLLSTTHHRSHCYQLRPTSDLPEEWEHVVHGDGEDVGLVFCYRWVPLEPRPQLWGHDDPVLALIQVP